VKINFTKLAGILFFSISLFIVDEAAFCAASQIITDAFYQNPAELSSISRMQMMVGDLFLAPRLEFSGQSTNGAGTARSKVSDNLPYFLSAIRLNDRFVMGLNLTPSSYGHIEWPLDSIVAEVSTKTDVIYYRASIQSSYQLTNKLAIGAGINAEINKLYELDFVIPNKGNQVNKISGLNSSADIGLLYKFNPKLSLTAAIYTPVKAFGFGSSMLNSTRTNNFSLNITEPSVIFIGLQHNLSEKWFLEPKVYWSGWGIQKNIDFRNTTTGSVVVPTNWRDAWSYQILTRYATNERIAILGAVLYETNVNPTVTNNIGYPVSNSAFISAGVDVSLQKSISLQLMYGYGLFTLKSKIDTSKSNGSVSANTQAAVVQCTYKI
jgi:long-subunit fatty acid transport protein